MRLQWLSFLKIWPRSNYATSWEYVGWEARVKFQGMTVNQKIQVSRPNRGHCTLSKEGGCCCCWRFYVRGSVTRLPANMPNMNHFSYYKCLVLHISILSIYNNHKESEGVELQRLIRPTTETREKLFIFLRKI